MHNPLHQERVKAVYKMLLALANGALSHRIALQGDDAFDALAKLLNNVAEKMQEHQYQSPFTTTQLPISQDTDAGLQLVQQAQDYILNHLNEPLPGAKTLAKLFGTNAYTLKEAFRNHHSSSIYQFYIETRLQKAHFLITHTEIPLMEIPDLCGFNDYSTFLKAFKKRFNGLPTGLPRGNGFE